MNSAYSAPRRLVELLAAMTERKLRFEERALLNQLLNDDVEARDYYLQYVNLHTSLEFQFGPERLLEVPLEGSTPKVARFPGIWVGYLAAAAALMVIAFAIARNDPDGVGREEPVATLLDFQNATWANDPVPKEGQPLSAGTRMLATGTARIELDSGAVIALQAPVEFDLPGGNRLALHRGAVRAYAPPRARGFVVTAAGLKIEDLGTEFGVRVDQQDAVEVHVFVGQVRINDQIPLAAGDARRVQNRKAKPIKLNGKAFPIVRR